MSAHQGDDVLEAAFALVRRVRGDFVLPGCALLDGLFVELLLRGSTTPQEDCHRLARELDADTKLAAAMHDEYIFAFSVAVATVHQVGAAAPRRIWPAALPEQTELIQRLATVIADWLATDLRAVEGFPGEHHGRASVAIIDAMKTAGIASRKRKPPRSVFATVESIVDEGQLLAIDHDYVWGRLERLDARSRYRRHKAARGAAPTTDSIESLTRRRRLQYPNLGLQSEAMRRGGKTWLRRIRTKLWYQRLLPLHPRVLSEDDLRKVHRILRERRSQRARVEHHDEKRETPTSQNLVDWLLPHPLWLEAFSILKASSRLSGFQRSHLLSVLVALHYNAPWEAFPSKLGLGEGNTVRRRLLLLRDAGVWQELEQAIRRHHPGVSFVERRPGSPRPGSRPRRSR